MISDADDSGYDSEQPDKAAAAPALPSPAEKSAHQQRTKESLLVQVCGSLFPPGAGLW